MKAMILAALLGVSVLAPAPAPVPDYGGAWTLDPVRSTDLPPFYAQVRSHRLQVAQTDARLSVDVTIQSGGAQPERFALEQMPGGGEMRFTMVFVRD